jgi:D-glycero-alpha-D-manno-heptose-7-phosphate kinase
MVELSNILRIELTQGNIDSLGEILHDGWMYKRDLASGITNSRIDYYYDLARKNGALGGKLLGAGGGGFLLFYAKEDSQGKIRNALKDLNELDFEFDTIGTTVIYYG